MLTNQEHFMQELGKVNQIYLEEMQNTLLMIYHKLLYDKLTVDDIQELGAKWDLDIELEYAKIIESIEHLDEDE